MLQGFMRPRPPPRYRLSRFMCLVSAVWKRRRTHTWPIARAVATTVTTTRGSLSVLSTIVSHPFVVHYPTASTNSSRTTASGLSFWLSFGPLQASYDHTCCYFLHARLAMLRLKTSEITLTPADVDETIRRMHRRQAANPPTTLPASMYGPRLPPLVGPRLRRGPERSRDDAIATLGNIPILRPRQVVVESADDAEHVPPPIEVLAEAEESGSTGSSTSSVAGDQTPNATSTRLHVPVPIGNLELPLRLTPSAREAIARPAGRGTFSEHLPSSPPKQLFRSPRFGQERTNSSEDGNESTPQARIHAATDGQVDDPDTIHATPTNGVRSLRQHSSFNPSPLQHMLTISSPRQRGGSGDPDLVRDTGSRFQKQPQFTAECLIPFRPALLTLLIFRLGM